VKREVAVGAVGAAVVVAALAGCSSKSTNSSSSGGASANSPITTKVTVDGQDQNVSGAATCTTAGDNVNIGIGDPANGIGAVVTNTDPPAVHAVGLGSPNGSTLGYSDANQGQGSAQAVKQGNGYKISGTAVGMDTSNSQSVTKPFELDVACP
jgi:lipoprotein LpqH